MQAGGQDLMMTNISDDLEPAMHNVLRFLAILVMVVTFLVGIPGNILVLWITSKKMKWTVNTIWFWNLAVADFICCLSIPLSIAQDFYNEWLYGPALCKVIPVIVHLNMFSSVFTLVAISADRCILVVQPVWAQNHRSLRLARILCVVIWVLSFLMCLPAALHRETFMEFNQTLCDYKYEKMFSNLDGEFPYEFNYTDYVYVPYDEENQQENASIAHTITLTRFIFGFLIPFLIITACYLRLTLKVQDSRFLRAGRKTTKVVFSIVIAFFVTWVPYHVMGVISMFFYNSLLKNLDSLSIALAYFNSCINPILYVFMGKDMKSRMRQSIRRVMESAFSEEFSRSKEHTRSKTIVQDSMIL